MNARTAPPPRMPRRWSDNQKRFGPFTYSRDTTSKPLSIALDSGEGEHPGCHLRLRGFGHTVIVELPPILLPYREKIAAGWDAATIERMGRDWYWNEDNRELGFSYCDGFLMVFLGRQTYDSSTDRKWCKHLPWTQWRHVRDSLYGLDGEPVWTQWTKDNRESGFSRFEKQRAAQEACPALAFEFDDYDGARITATTRIEEREYRFGEGWLKWLSLFRKPLIRRSLDIDFSAEVGPEKGSWKGGTMGTGIDMLPGELHEAAFRRYCAQDHRSKHRMFRVAFVGAAPASAPK